MRVIEARLPICFCLSRDNQVSPCGSVVEHTLGKGEAAGSIPAMGSIFIDKSVDNQYGFFILMKYGKEILKKLMISV